MMNTAGILREDENIIEMAYLIKDLVEMSEENFEVSIEALRERMGLNAHRFIEVLYQERSKAF